MNELDIRNNYLEHYKKENEMFNMAKFILSNEMTKDGETPLIMFKNKERKDDK